MKNSTLYYIVTFGCQQNEADSERIASILKSRGMVEADDVYSADHVVINTCMVREKAENRVYGQVFNLSKRKATTGKPDKIVVTGCMVGMAARDKSGKFLKLIKKRLPLVDEFLPIEEVGFDHAPLRTSQIHAWVPVSNGCNNFCTFCVVPFTRGRETSRPYEDIVQECQSLASKGYRKITFLGMNVNSYGADLIKGPDNVQVLRDLKRVYFDKKDKNSPAKKNNLQKYHLPDGTVVKPVVVSHLGRLRIPTLFPYLLKDVCKIDRLEEIDFMSSNPWDFSDELIDVIAGNPKITRSLHIAVQSGSDTVLKRMNRWYTRQEFLRLVSKLKSKIKDLKLSTDFIVGFCSETEMEFQETVDLVKKVKFYKAYISMYSDRPMTAAHKAFKDDVPHRIKKERWKILENMINRPKQ